MKKIIIISLVALAIAGIALAFVLIPGDAGTLTPTAGTLIPMGPPV